MPKWSKLSEYVTLECDGVDFTPQLRKHRVHSILFANIPSFGAGIDKGGSEKKWTTLLKPKIYCQF